jgi:RND family efflux transporter MFP subunit
MSLRSIMLKIVLPFVIIGLGVAAMVLMVATRPEPRREVRQDPGALVEVITVKKADHRVTVKGTGTVQPAQEISVVPQVGGRITFASPSLVAGGFFRKGELLFSIEDTDYRLALERAEAMRAKAEYELATMESQAEVARVEWERLYEESAEEPNPLVLYEPQLKNARAALASARASVRQAEIDLERTQVRAPFNSRARSEDVDLGQYVRAGASVAVLAGTDTAEIAVPLPLDELRWLSIPKNKSEGSGSSASVRLSIGGVLYEWQGRVIRSTGEVDPGSRMMHVVVGVKDPYGLARRKDARPPLAAGAFVDVHLAGTTLSDVHTIPRRALRDNARVWAVHGDDTLRIKNVTPLRLERDVVVIGEGLAEGDRLVLTTISGAADGMRLRPMEEGADK